MNAKKKRRVALGTIEPLDIGSNNQCHTKSSRGFAVGDRVKDGWNFGVIQSFDAENVTIAWHTGDCDRVGHPTSTYSAAWQVYQDLKKCSYNLTSVAGSAQDFLSPHLLQAALNSSDCVNGMNTAVTSSPNDLRSKSYPTLRTVTGKAGNKSKMSLLTSSPLRLPVSPLVFKENAKEQQTSETVSAQSLKRSQFFSPNSSPLKTSQDSSPVPTSLATPLGHISAIFSGHYSRAGTMHNGFVSAADTLERPSLENGYCWLESPNALSSTGKGRPPGQSRLEAQLKKLGVLEKREVLNPQFLEKTYNLPLDWTNPQELRVAMELLERDALPLATASIPESQVSPSVASCTLIPSVNNYSPLVLEGTNSYASVIPLELTSNEKDCNKKVLGDSNYLASVIPLEPKQSLVLGDNQNNSLPLEPEQEPNLVLGDSQDNPCPLEPEQKRSLVLEEGNSYAAVIPLEPEQERSQVLGDDRNNPFPPEPKPTTRRKASGWLERYTKTKKLKGGAIATYPRVEGERDPNNSEHWYFAYRWEEKRDTAKSDNGYVTRAVSLPKNKVEAVQLAIARRWSPDEILSFIRGAEERGKITP